jgi:hypothetical protein
LLFALGIREVGEVTAQSLARHFGSLENLAQASEAANSTLQIDEVLKIIMGQLLSTLDVAQCYVGEWHPDQRDSHPGRVIVRCSGSGIHLRPVMSPPRAGAQSAADGDCCRRILRRGTDLAAPPLSRQPDRASALAAQDQPLGVVSLAYFTAPRQTDFRRCGAAVPLALMSR